MNDAEVNRNPAALRLTLATWLDEPVVEACAPSEAVTGTLQALEDLECRLNLLIAERDTLKAQLANLEQLRIEHVIWRTERREIHDTLIAFLDAPVTLSSLQPILAMAEEMKRRR